MRFIFILFVYLFASVSSADSLFSHLMPTTDKLTYQDENKVWKQFPVSREPLNRNVFIFDPQKHIWAVYDKEGELVGAGKGSGGKDYCPDIGESCRTVVGKFTVFRREAADCTSKTFPIDEGG